MKTTRRSFVKGAAAVGASAGIAPLVAARRVLGANEDLRVAVIGLNGRGWNHVNGFQRLDGVRVTVLCDVDQRVLDGRLAEFEKKHGHRPEGIVDYRDVLAAGDVDVVSIATQNHWHALMAIQACQAGKDVYVEKPISHNIWEGRQLVRAAEKYQRIVQSGTQSRSNPGLQQAVAFVRDGSLGEIRLARGLCYKPRASIGHVQNPAPIPDHIDYDLWCGPAPLEPLMRSRLHYDWHWVWATGNGDLGNQGIHQMDMCRMALGESKLAPWVTSFGGRLGYVDDGETPNTLVSVFEYDTAPLIFEVRGLPRAAGDKQMDRYLGASIGCVIHCEGGFLRIDSYDGGTAFDREGREIRKFSGSADHFANFVAAVRSRKPQELNAPILEGHISSALCHMGNISYRVGAPADTGALETALMNDVPAIEAWWRTRDHLRANSVDLGATPVSLGRRLRLDPETEWFVGADVDAANRLAKGSYREPFVVPEEV